MPEQCRHTYHARMEVDDFRLYAWWNMDYGRKNVQQSVVGRQDFPTREKPVCLRVNRGGNDNWALFFATVDEAESTAALLEACQPLDWDRDVLPLGFAFVN